MHIKTIGFGSRGLSACIRKAAQFYAQELMSKRLEQNLYLEVVCKKNDNHFTESGLAEWLDQTPSPKEFRITISRQKKSRYEEYFKILAHEMVHIKQYAKNEMTSLVKAAGPNQIEQYWRGMKVKVASKRSPIANKTKVITDSKGHDYYYQPWEVEAYGLEVGLYAYLREQHPNKWMS